MPLSRVAADAFGAVTICLVAILILLGFLCIAYSLYFRSQVRSQGYLQLGYFSGAWITRIIFVLFLILWGIGEVLRLSLLRRRGRALESLGLQWQEAICKGYIVSNLGFSEPCLFLTLVFLLRAPLQKIEQGIFSQKWNWITAARVIVWCSPVFVLQLMLVLIGPQLSKHKSSSNRLPSYFTRTSTPVVQNVGALCTYPLLNTILLGLFATILTAYLFWLGKRILKLVINKVLQKRVYTILVSVSSFLPLRVLLLGLSVLSKPENIIFELLSFLAFLVFSCCGSICICMLVYYPIADALALGNLQDLEARKRAADSNERISLLANDSHPGETGRLSPETNSESSTKRGSISFRAYEKEGTSTSSLVELSFFSPSHDGATPPPHESPPSLSWQMRLSH